MRFVIVGAGALGSIYTACLARAGNHVDLVARGERAAQLAQHGISVVGHQSFTAHCNIVTDAAAIEEADALILAVKTYHTEAALHSLRGARVGAAFSIQNGVLKNDMLDAAFGPGTTIGAIGMLGGEVLPAEGNRPGAVDYKMPGATVIGERDGKPSSRVDSIVAALEAADLQVRSAANITAVEWAKFVNWSGVSALAVLTRLPTYRFLVEADTARLAARVVRETAAVAAAAGVALEDSGMIDAQVIHGSEDDAVEKLMANGERMRGAGFRQSILQDADRGRQLEVDETLGHTLRLGAELGVPTPTLDYCCRVLSVVSSAALD